MKNLIAWIWEGIVMLYYPVAQIINENECPEKVLSFMDHNIH